MAKEYITIAPRNLVWPRARFFNDADQVKYEPKVNKNYHSEKAKDSLINENLRTTGSNLFKVLELQSQGVRVANLAEITQISEQHREWLSGFYADVPAVVLRSASDSYQQNDFLAKDLARQLGVKDFKNPLVVSGLIPEESKISFYGLRLVTNDKTTVFEAPQISHKNNQRKFSEFDERGMPILNEDNRGAYTLYTREDGLSRLDVLRSGSLDSNWNDLAVSDSFGRVVIVENSHDALCSK